MSQQRLDYLLAATAIGQTPSVYYATCQRQQLLVRHRQCTTLLASGNSYWSSTVSVLHYLLAATAIGQTPSVYYATYQWQQLLVRYRQCTMLLTSGNSYWSDTISVLRNLLAATAIGQAPSVYYATYQWQKLLVRHCQCTLVGCVWMCVCSTLSTCAQQLRTDSFIYNYKMNLLL